MLLILSEDEGMGLSFWSKINEHCLKGKAVVTTSKGITSIVDKVKEFSLSKEDKVLFAIDNVDGYAVRAALRGIENDSKERGYTFSVSTYHCIEEVFLSFRFLGDWMQLSDDVRQGIWLPIFKFVTGQTNFDYSESASFRARFPGANTREQLASMYLNNLTYNKGGGWAKSERFWVHKSTYGSCWYEDCLKGSNVPFICNHKGYTCYLYIQELKFSSRAKLKFFWNNSILVDTVPSLELLRRCI